MELPYYFTERISSMDEIRVFVGYFGASNRDQGAFTLGLVWRNLWVWGVLF